MRRAIFGLALALTVVAGLSFSQAQDKAMSETGEHAANTVHEKSEAGSLDIWKWINFLVLVGGLGYLIRKNAGPFFASRSADIRKDMDESLRKRREAEAVVAEVDRRLASLEAQITALRAESAHELATATERISQQSAEQLEKIRAHAGQEIASAGKQARFELKRYSAELAMGLAEQKVRARMTPATQDMLTDSFLRDLK